MKQFHRLIIILIFIYNISVLYAQDHPLPKTLVLGSKAPDFRLRGVDDKFYTLKSFSKAKILLIVFSAVHCPTAQAYEERIKAIQKDYRSQGVQVAMINPNNPNAVCLEEMGYSDMGDSFAEMKQRAKDHAFNFPFLNDGDEQKTASAYGPAATPHVFIFDQDRVLRYVGRIDNGEKIGTATQNDARNAIDALLKEKEVQVKETKVFGCSIKWKWKNEYHRKLDDEWAQKPVKLEKISLQDLAGLLQNKSPKLRVINLWATWCGPCVAEFSGLVETYRMYQARDFELYTVNLDKISQEGKVLRFLSSRQASFTGNYIFGDENRYEMIETVDPQWQGNLPYTVIIEPGGKIVYRFSGGLNMLDLRKKIVEHPLIGRYY